MIQIVKWFFIILYWIWLDIRNVFSYNSTKDWKLIIQIAINTIVIFILVIEEFGCAL